MNQKKEGLKLLKLLSDETRLNIVEFLLDGEKCVCEIFPHVKKTQSTTSIHLGKLEQEGILKSRRDGKKIFYGIKDLRICGIFKAIGYDQKKMLEKSCCMKKESKQ